MRLSTVSTERADPATRWSVLAPGSEDELIDLAADGTVLARARWDATRATELVAARAETRWVWGDTAHTYPDLLRAGARVDRAWDLRLCHRILRGSIRESWGPASDWDLPPEQHAGHDALFDLAERDVVDAEQAAAELLLQWRAIDAADDPRRLRLLLHGESAGALIAEEMRAAGLPWSAARHDRILVETLGRRSPSSGVPERMAELAERVRDALGDPAANVDSPPKLLRALRRAGMQVTSTSRWELVEQSHPVVAPLLAYKRMSRLWVANGWAWLDEWVRDGRFRPVYVPGGVVTGRWASSGGGALQIPRLLRPAVVADDGWVIVDADVAQLEPRVLAGMSRDLALAQAARGRDLYTGIVESGAVETREEAKYAVLGAMYGATTGESGRLVPRLRRAYPAAMRLVDDAAAAGEDGGTVRTWLGRTSPAPDAEWLALAADAVEENADAAARDRARRAARDRGRFTRNFVVQGTAAEWALCWLAEIRRRLDALGETSGARAERSGVVFAGRPHLVFFLHDEVMVHAPADIADAVGAALAEAAEAAGRRLFGSFPIDFPLDVAVTGDARADGES
ncbi:bifunctional 3'-5' exonuclease/DNA polymerase [Microbacterium sp. 18062]|uniref:bifunctional 3'-5' exonuclease/DNA polymerase n=1 Tax=Microbacterium sp. 18062 TaxID=2681410 RepID=UPI00135832E8